MRGAAVLLLFSLLVVLEGNKTTREIADVNLRDYCVVLEDVRAEPVGEREALFSFLFNGKREEFLFFRDDLLPRVLAYKAGGDSLAIVFGGWEKPMLRGFVTIDGVKWSIQPSVKFMREFPELKGSGATVAVPFKTLVDVFHGTGDFATEGGDEQVGDLRKRDFPNSPSTTLINGDAPDAEPNGGCTSDNNKKQLTIDTVTDGHVWGEAIEGLPGSATTGQIRSFIEDEVELLVNWVSGVYLTTTNMALECGQIVVKESLDSSGAGWNSGAGTSWNRACTGDRSQWFDDSLYSFSCWAGSQSNLNGGLVQLLSGCTWSGGGTAGKAWIDVACNANSFIFTLNGAPACAHKTSVSNFALSSSYLVVAHELGHNFGLNHVTNSNGIMSSSVTGVTQFSGTSQDAFCAEYGGGAASCVADFGGSSGGGGGGGGSSCACPASWECGTMCGADCPGLSCGSNQQCISNTCQNLCTPSCPSGSCGSDTCGGTCACSAGQFCNANNQCEAQSSGSSGIAATVNAERARFGTPQDFAVVDATTACLGGKLPATCTSASYDWSCGYGFFITLGYYSFTSMTTEEKIQHHINHLINNVGPGFDCSGDSFASESSYEISYRLMIDRLNGGREVGFHVMPGCNFGGTDDFKVATLWSPSTLSTPSILSGNCPSAGGNCVPGTCSASQSCHLNGTDDGCGGLMRCGCAQGHVCYDESCCKATSCMAEKYDCGVLEAGCGTPSENCGSCSGGATCFIEEGNTAGKCCTVRTCEDIGCAESLSAEENCGVELNCPTTMCGEAEECTFNPAMSKSTCCVPLTCEDIGCGTDVPNGCRNGETLDCPCEAGECRNNECCIPLTCEDITDECGEYTDGCGGVLSCGCPAGNCVQGSCEEGCAVCPVDNGCGEVECLGASVPCGETCESNEYCSEKTSCICIPASKEEACAGIDCGYVDDGCGQRILCEDACLGTQSCLEETNVCCEIASCEGECGLIELGCGTGLQRDCGECECPLPQCPTDAVDQCEVISNECGSVNCGRCLEGFQCDYLNELGARCVPEEDCCTCETGSAWNGYTCVTLPPAPGVNCDGVDWTDQRGLLTEDALFVFNPIDAGLCTLASSPLDRKCPKKMPLCANLFIFEPVSQNSLGDGVVVEVKDVGEDGPAMGVFMYGNNFINQSDAVRLKYWTGFIDRENDEVGVGPVLIDQQRQTNGRIRTNFLKPNPIMKHEYETQENVWYRLLLQRPQTTYQDDEICSVKFSVTPLTDGGEEGETWTIMQSYDCEEVNEMFDFEEGGVFGLVANQEAQFRNFAVVTVVNAEFNIFWPGCPSVDNVRSFIANLLAIGVDQVTDVTVGCGDNKKRQVAAAAIPISATLTSSSTQLTAAALASQLHFLLAASHAPVAWQASSGFATTAGGAGGAAGTGAPATLASVGAAASATGGGGGGGAGLSSGAVAGIAIGSAVAAGILGVGVGMAMRGDDDDGEAPGEDFGGGGADDASRPASSRKKKSGFFGIPVMRPESHRRRMDRGEVNSVTARGVPS